MTDHQTQKKDTEGRYIIGVDMGISSVGFAAVNVEDGDIYTAGSHVFDAAENPKTGASLALPRREKRLARRRLARKARRKQKLKNILSKALGQPVDGWFRPDHPVTIDNTPRGNGCGAAHKTVWHLRAEALDRPLTPEEFARVLMHIANHRGFKSNRKHEAKNAKNSEDGVMNQAASELRDTFKASGASTIGAYLSVLPKQKNRPGSYLHTITRDLLVDEMHTIFAAQRAHGNAVATPELEDMFVREAFHQRPLRSVAHLIGSCKLEAECPRAPKHSYSGELFVAWSRINTLRIRTRADMVETDTTITKHTRDERALTDAQRRQLMDALHTKKKLTFAQVRKMLGLEAEETFSLVSYRRTEAGETFDQTRTRAEKRTCAELAGYHHLRGALEPLRGKTAWKAWEDNRHILDEIARVLSIHSGDDETMKDLKTDVPELADAEIEALLPLIPYFTKTLDVSVKAIGKLLPHMAAGLDYRSACVEAGYEMIAKPGTLSRIPPINQDDVRNPVVLRAMSQTRHVINVLIDRYGLPKAIHIELTRDVGKSKQDRAKIEKEIAKNTDNNMARKEHAKETFNRDVSGDELIKFRLWEEQKHHCIYSGHYISPEQLKDSTSTEVDHILPYSQSFDNSLHNRVLVLTGANRGKSNKIPHDFLSENDFRDLAHRAKALPQQKQRRLLMTDFDQRKQEEWKARHLTDTSYAARAMRLHIMHNLRAAPGCETLNVATRNGALTSMLRRRWGLGYKDRATDLHHAMDAIILACSTQSIVQRFSEWHRDKNATKSDKNFYPTKPWDTFREDALEVVDQVFVSRLSNTSTRGALHEDTIKSLRISPAGEKTVVKRVRVGDLKLKDLPNIVGIEVAEDGTVSGRTLALYTALHDRLSGHDNDPKKAFANPVHMPTKSGALGPEIRSVKLITNDRSGVQLPSRGFTEYPDGRTRLGMAANGDMVRTDVYLQKDKYLLVPVYTHQVARGETPMKAIQAGKEEADWRPVTPDEFVFSLHKNEYVKLTDKKGEITEGYFVGTDRANGSISLRVHDGSKLNRGIGVSRMTAFQKFTVNVFGEMTEILPNQYQPETT